MAKCYQCDHDGYYVGETEDFGGFLPSGAVYDAPEQVEGMIPKRSGDAWVQVENHKGEAGYLNGLPHTIIAYGPYPEGWSKTPPPLSPEEQLEADKIAFTYAIQRRLDDFAVTRNYDNALSCASYATSTHQKFAVEAQYMVAVRDATWEKAYEILDAVLAGERPMPSLEEVMAELPALEWPEVHE
jgi:hypothetical protein